MVDVHACQISKNVDGFAFFLRSCGDSRTAEKDPLCMVWDKPRVCQRLCVAVISRVDAGVCCTDSCRRGAILPTTRLVRFSRHVMVVWAMYGHRTEYASTEVDGEVERGDLVSSVERWSGRHVLPGQAKATLQTFENALAALSDFMYSELA